MAGAPYRRLFLGRPLRDGYHRQCGEDTVGGIQLQGQGSEQPVPDCIASPPTKSDGSVPGNRTSNLIFRNLCENSGEASLGFLVNLVGKLADPGFVAGLQEFLAESGRLKRLYKGTGKGNSIQRYLKVHATPDFVSEEWEAPPRHFSLIGIA